MCPNKCQFCLFEHVLAALSFSNTTHLIILIILIPASVIITIIVIPNLIFDFFDGEEESSLSEIKEGCESHDLDSEGMKDNSKKPQRLPA